MGQSYSGLGTKSKRPECIRRVLALSLIGHSGGESVLHGSEKPLRVARSKSVSRIRVEDFLRRLFLIDQSSNPVRDRSRACRRTKGGPGVWRGLRGPG